MSTFIVGMLPNADGRRKTTKLTADDVNRDGEWIRFYLDPPEDEPDGAQELVAEFRNAEFWMDEDATMRPVDDEARPERVMAVHVEDRRS
jgi:hypothetical protein